MDGSTPRCTACDTTIPPSARFCDHCGAPLPRAEGPVQVRGNRRATWMWGLLGGAVLLLALLVPYFWLRPDGAASGPASDVAVPDGVFLVTLETWDGEHLAHWNVEERTVSHAPGRFRVAASAVALEVGAEAAAVAFVGDSVAVEASSTGGHVLDQAGWYQDLGDAVLRTEAGTGGTLALLLPTASGVAPAGNLPVTFQRQRFQAAGEGWWMARMVSAAAPVSSPSDGLSWPTIAHGTWIWNEARTRLVLADVWVAQDRAGGAVWARVLVEDLGPGAREVVRAAGIDPVQPEATRAAAPAGEEAMAEVALLARSALAGASLQAEQATNPVFLTAMALLYLADGACTVALNAAHDMELRERGGEHPFHPFDGEVESPLEKYVARNAARVVARRLHRAGWIDEADVETVAYWGGKIYYEAGGIVASVGAASVGLEITKGAGHFAAVAASHAGLSKAALNALSRTLGFLGWHAKDVPKAWQALRLGFGLQEMWNSREVTTGEIQVPLKAAPRGTLAPQVDVRSGPLGARVVLVMDTSGSMGDDRAGVLPIEQAQAAVTMAASTFRPQDAIGLVTFDEEATVVRALGPLGDELARLRAAVRRLEASGGTCFAAGLGEAGRQLGRGGGGPGSIVFVSDGLDHCGGLDVALASLRDQRVTLYTIPVGADADEATLCRMAEGLAGWCLPVTDRGLKRALIQLVNDSRGLTTVAHVRDVIRPGEVQELEVRLDPQGLATPPEYVQLTGEWQGRDLVVSARSPSGRQYATDDAQGAFTAGSAQEGYRVLGVPWEPGSWSVRVASGQDVPAPSLALSAAGQGSGDLWDRLVGPAPSGRTSLPETPSVRPAGSGGGGSAPGAGAGVAYSLDVSVPTSSTRRLRPLGDVYDPGEPVELEVESMAASGGTARLHGPAASAPVPLRCDGQRCVATLQAPSEPGYYPVELDLDGDAGRTWTTLPVGTADAIVASRDRWRPAAMAWAPTGGGGAGLEVVALLVVGGAVLLLVLVSRGGRRRPGLRLEIRTPDGGCTTLPCPGPAIRVGRDSSNDVVVEVPEVSRHHLVIEVGGGGAVLVNLTGTDNTTLDGQGVPSGQRVPLPPGVEVRLAGGVFLAVKEPGSGVRQSGS